MWCKQVWRVRHKTSNELFAIKRSRMKFRSRTQRNRCVPLQIGSYCFGRNGHPRKQSLSAAFFDLTDLQTRHGGLLEAQAHMHVAI